MLEQLLDLIKQQGEETVVRNPAIPNEQNNQVLSEAGNSIMKGLQGALAGGGLSQVMKLFSNQWIRRWQYSRQSTRTKHCAVFYRATYQPVPGESCTGSTGKR